MLLNANNNFLYRIFFPKKNVPPLMSYDVTKNKEENPLNPLKNHWKKSAG